MAGQLKTLDHAGIGLWQYSYDAVGNRTQMSTPTGTHTYAYGATDRLTSASHPTGPVETYSYDTVGNRLTDATASYTYDAAHRLLSKTGVSYTWDANGNLTGKTDATRTTTYRYEGDNRLVQVTRGGSTLASFTYDAFGRRVSKTTSTGTVYFVYDGEDILAEVDASGNLLTYYVHGPGIDEPLAMVRGGQTYYYHADALGTITHLTNASGAVVQSYDYDSFGNLTAQSGSVTQPYTYTAREWDAETSLYYYRARYYDPQVGRFITEDPIGVNGGINLYGYVRNNPIKRTDPRGLASFGFGFGGTCNIGPLGAGADSGIIFDTRGTVCFYTTTCWLYGWNSLAGGAIGAVGQVGSGCLCSGRQKCRGGYWFGGSGWAGEGQVFVCGDGGVEYGRGIVGRGGGAGAGYIECETQYYCLNEPKDCKCR